MNLLTRIFLLMFLVGFYMPSHAAVNTDLLASCDVYSADEGKKEDKDDKKGEEEEPDCE